MQEYFILQYKMLNRKLTYFGIPPTVSYILLPICFVLCSNYLFSQTVFAGYLYAFIALSLISKLSEAKRNDFLKSIFSKWHYLILRSTENIIYSIPFSAFLVYKALYLPAILLLLAAMLIACFTFNTHISFTIPTPFSKKPFEFTVGFRKTFFVFPVAYIMTLIAILTSNFNLGIFSMALICLIACSYFVKPEHEYIIWNVNRSSRHFLFLKIKNSLMHFSFLTLPITITLILFFFDHTYIILTFMLLCYTYLTVVILAKYAAYPHEISLPQGILLSLSLLLPPILVVIIPLFYSQSIKNLKPILK